MSWHVAALNLDNLDDLPKRCRRCVFWELSETLGRQAQDFGSTELEKEAWISEVLLEWGSCGRIVHMGGVPAGYVIYAPPSAVPRSTEMPTGPVSADAVLLTTMQVMPEFSGEGLGRMLAQAVVRDLTRRGVKAIEVFGDQRPGTERKRDRLHDVRPSHRQYGREGRRRDCRSACRDDAVVGAHGTAFQRRRDEAEGGRA